MPWPWSADGVDRTMARLWANSDIQDVPTRYPGYLCLMCGRRCPMTMVKTPIEIDEEALRTAAEVLGTKTKKDTVNAALREVGQRLTRLSALARLGEMADRGDFDEFLDNKRAYRR
jgi:Arc/MetJ family transcription regulator